MKRLITWLFALMILPVMVATANAAEFEEGVHYQRVSQKLPTTSGKKIEVAEMFWYGCPHCNQFEPFIKRWKAKLASDVQFVRIPAMFRPEWEVHARAYYISEALGVVEKTHAALFTAMHDQRRNINTLDEVAALYAELGINRKDFDQAAHSFATESKIRRAKDMVRRSGIDGVPALIVNGKYRIDAQMAGGYPNMLKVADFLVEKERKGK